MRAVQLRQHVGADQRLRMRREMRRAGNLHGLGGVLDKCRRVAGGDGACQGALFATEGAAGQRIAIVMPAEITPAQRELLEKTIREIAQQKEAKARGLKPES